MSLNEITWEITQFCYFPANNTYLLEFKDTRFYSAAIFKATVTYNKVVHLPQLNPLYLFREPRLEKNSGSHKNFTTQITITDAPIESGSNEAEYELIFQYFENHDGTPNPTDIKVRPKIKFSEVKADRNEEIVSEA